MYGAPLAKTLAPMRWVTAGGQAMTVVILKALVVVIEVVILILES